jgi:hypothetical protein
LRHHGNERVCLDSEDLARDTDIVVIDILPELFVIGFMGRT